jgi:hypothetical protein
VRTLHFGFVMHFDQGVHAQFAGGGFDFGHLPVVGAATMIRIASAPIARASAHCHGSTMKSLRMTGSAGGSRGNQEVFMPLKMGASVRTERQAAPPAS